MVRYLNQILYMYIRSPIAQATIVEFMSFPFDPKLKSTRIL